jgi:regulator of RNase E activity RraA
VKEQPPSPKPVADKDGLVINFPADRTDIDEPSIADVRQFVEQKTTGKRQGEAGAIVDGGVRDIDHSRHIGYPVWSSSVSPATGKWRIETVGINVPVVVAGVTVHPGDLVIADEVGVCFVPRARAAEVLETAQRLEQSEEARLAKIAGGMPLAEFLAIPRQK